MKFSKLLLFATIITIIASCETNPNLDPQYLNEQIVAGYGASIKNLNLELNIDSINSNYCFDCSWSCTGEHYSHIDFFNDGMDNLVITTSKSISYCDTHRKMFEIDKYFYVNLDLEFVLQEWDTLVYDGEKRISLIKPLNKEQLINDDLNWINPDSSEIYISYWSDVDENNLVFEEINYEKLQIFNPNINDKFIGIRKKKGDHYIYGWINFSVLDNEKLTFKSCSFSDWE